MYLFVCVCEQPNISALLMSFSKLFFTHLHMIFNTHIHDVPPHHIEITANEGKKGLILDLV